MTNDRRIHGAANEAPSVGSEANEISRFADALAPLRPRPLPLPEDIALPPAAAPHDRWRLHALAGAAAVLVVAVIISLTLRAGDGGAWHVEHIAGAARIDGRAITGTGRLDIGETLTTGAEDEVRVIVANIGHFDVAGAARLRLLATGGPNGQRVELDHGRIEAVITAPPRLFFVNMAAAVAVDMGCAYVLDVDDAGNGFLEVTVGWVSLERDGVAFTVPSGAGCAIDGERGPGTPFFLDADAALRSGVLLLDGATDGSGDDCAAALVDVLAAARPRDALTLWHLLRGRGTDDRRRIATRLDELVTLPADLPVAVVAAGDPDALDRLWSALRRHW